MQPASRSRSCSLKKRGISLSFEPAPYFKVNQKPPKIIYNRLPPSHVRITGAPKLFSQLFPAPQAHNLTFSYNNNRVSNLTNAKQTNSYHLNKRMSYQEQRNKEILRDNLKNQLNHIRQSISQKQSHLHQATKSRTANNALILQQKLATNTKKICQAEEQNDNKQYSEQFIINIKKPQSPQIQLKKEEDHKTKEKQSHNNNYRVTKFEIIEEQEMKKQRKQQKETVVVKKAKKECEQMINKENKQQIKSKVSIKKAERLKIIHENEAKLPEKNLKMDLKILNELENRVDSLITITSNRY